MTTVAPMLITALRGENLLSEVGTNDNVTTMDDGDYSAPSITNDEDDHRDSHCYCCTISFSQTLKKQYCGFCGEVICKGCCSQSGSNQADGGPNLCVMCLHASLVSKSDPVPLSPIHPNTSSSSNSLHGSQIQHSIQSPKVTGELQKWVNNMYGWQRRFFILENGSLSELIASESTHGVCHSTLDLTDPSTKVRTSKHSTRRFEISQKNNNKTFICLAKTEEDRNRWVSAVIASARHQAVEAASNDHVYQQNQRQRLLNRHSTPQTTPKPPGNQNHGSPNNTISDSRDGSGSGTDEFEQNLVETQDFAFILQEQAAKLSEYWAALVSETDNPHKSSFFPPQFSSLSPSKTSSAEKAGVCNMTVRRDVLKFKSSLTGCLASIRALHQSMALMKAEAAKVNDDLVDKCAMLHNELATLRLTQPQEPQLHQQQHHQHQSQSSRVNFTPHPKSMPHQQQQQQQQQQVPTTRQLTVKELLFSNMNMDIGLPTPPQTPSKSPSTQRPPPTPPTSAPTSAATSPFEKIRPSTETRLPDGLINLSLPRARALTPVLDSCSTSASFEITSDTDDMFFDPMSDDDDRASSVVSLLSAIDFTNTTNTTVIMNANANANTNPARNDNRATKAHPQIVSILKQSSKILNPPTTSRTTTANHDVTSISIANPPIERDGNVHHQMLHLEQSETANEDGDANSDDLDDDKDDVETQHQHHPLRVSSDVAIDKAMKLLQTETSDWPVVYEDGGMVVTRSENTDSDDPISVSKTEATVHGISALEICEYYFEPNNKKEWDGSIKSFDVLQRIGDDLIAMLLLHYRIWPSAQRESCIMSRTKQLEDGRWLVCTETIDHSDAPPHPERVRTTCLAVMVAENMPAGSSSGGPPDRSSMSTRIQYFFKVNPGGNVPMSLVKVMSKREFPKLFAKLGDCAVKKYASEEIRL